MALDDGRRVIELNAEATTLLGYDEGALVGQPLSVLLSPTVRVFFGTYVYPQLASSGRVDEVYALLRRRDGSDLPVLLTAARRKEWGDFVTDLVFLAVKRRALFERNLERLHEALARSPGSASPAQAEVTDRMTTLGVLTAGLMHELRNPLTYVVGSLDALQAELESPTPDGRAAREYLGEVRDGVGRIRALADAVSLVSRVEPARGARFEVGAVVAAAVRLVRHRIGTGQLRVEGGGPPALVEGEEARLAQVLMNLIVNAAQATQALAGQGQVVVRHAVDGGMALIQVSDNGPGVPDGLRERIFEAFFTTKPVGEGTGLGLPISRQIVESLGGTLSLGVPSEGGATFQVRLPLAS